MNVDFWRNKKVFITGHTGFKGSWLCTWLKTMGAQISGYSLPVEPGGLFELVDGGDDINSIVGDVSDFDHLRESIASFGPDIVIHMAAQSLVRTSYQEPVRTYLTNVMGTVNLFESIRGLDTIKGVVNVTTDKCYENKEWLWAYRENESLGGYDPYSSSKACSELVTSAYRQSFFNPLMGKNTAIASARAGNVIGGGDFSLDRLVPDALKAFGQGSPVSIRNPKSVRPWQHVLEPLRGYLTLAEHLFNGGSDYAEPWNFGPGDADTQTVEQVIELIAKEWGEGAKWAISDTDQPHEANQLRLDISKARTLLSWTPILNLKSAISMTVEWERNRLSKKHNIRHFTEGQIKDYMKELSLS